jgi:small subunit ribosomal protein S6
MEVKKQLRTYQTVVIIDSLLKSDEIDAIIEKIVRNINNNGGKITNIDRWEKKRLTYEIKKRQYGYYVEIVFEAPSNLIKIMERDYRLDENILRYLTVHLDSKALAYRERQQQRQTAGTVAAKDADVDKIAILEEVENNFLPLEEDDAELNLVQESSSEQ